jgi:phage-related protein (TIGR01555 family)
MDAAISWWRGPFAIDAAPDPAPAPMVRRDNGSIENAYTGLGGDHDKGAMGRTNLYWYPLGDQEHRIQARRSGLTSRLLGLIPGAATRKGWEIVVARAEQADRDRIEEAARVDRDLNLAATVAEAWTIANRDGGCLVWMVLDEAPNARDSRGRPVVDLQRPPRKVRAVQNLVICERVLCSSAGYETDPADRGFYAPAVYLVSLPMVGDGSRYIHASRLMVFRGAKISPLDRYNNSGWDDSFIDRWWDDLRNKIAIGQIGASIAQELSVKVFKIGGLDAGLAEDQATTIASRLTSLKRYMGAVGMAVMTGEDELQQVGSTVTGFKELTEEAWAALCATTGFPRTVITGDAPGGLNADGRSQEQNFHARVASEQASDLSPELRKYYDLMLPTVGITDGYDIQYRPLDQPTEAQQADTRQKNAQTDQVYVDLGVLTPDEVRQSRFGSAKYSAETTLSAEGAPDLYAAQQAAIAEQIAAASPKAAPVETPPAAVASEPVEAE